MIKKLIEKFFGKFCQCKDEHLQLYEDMPEKEIKTVCEKHPDSIKKLVLLVDRQHNYGVLQDELLFHRNINYYIMFISVDESSLFRFNTNKYIWL